MHCVSVKPFRCDCPWNYTGTACNQLHAGFCIDRRDLPPVNTCTMGDPTLQRLQQARGASVTATQASHNSTW